MPVIDKSFLEKYETVSDELLDVMAKHKIDPWEGTLLLAFQAGLSAGVGQFPINKDLIETLAFGFKAGATFDK